jgi:hypothetical protein
MLKNYGNEFGLVVVMLHLCLSLLRGLDPGLEGVHEVGADKGVLCKNAKVEFQQGAAGWMKLNFEMGRVMPITRALTRSKLTIFVIFQSPSGNV